MSAMIAAGGLRMGQAVGSSTARGERPQDNRVTASRVLATIYGPSAIDAAPDVPEQHRSAHAHPG